MNEIQYLTKSLYRIIRNHNNPLYISVYILYIMVDRYWRQIESVENNIENSMQISSILLKLKENDDVK